MSMLLYDMKQGRRWITVWVGGAVVFVLFFVSVAVIWSQLANPNQSLTDEQGQPKVGLEVYATGTFEVFDCIAEGTSCPRFDDAKESLSEMGDSFAYTPLPGKSSPGASREDGVKVVTFTDLSDREWEQVGQAVMRDGAITIDSVPTSGMDVEGSKARFQVPDTDGSSPVEGVVSFEHSGDAKAPQDVRLLSVTYSGGG